MGDGWVASDVDDKTERDRVLNMQKKRPEKIK
jgi:hypothetical protein